MKNKVLAAIFVFGSFAAATAQNLTNISFENWAVDTNYLNLSIPGVGTVTDTAVVSEPLGWTSTNTITGGRIFNHLSLATQSSTAYVGTSSLQLLSDTVQGAVGPLAVNIVAPAFVISGKFPIDLQSFALAASAGSFNPLTIGGAGVAISGRKAKIGGYLKYAPQGGDTAYVIALLRQGSTVVAQATYTRASTDAAYSYFEAPFVYQSCLEPDTLVYVIASGNPYTYNKLISGQPTGLHRGSTLLADSVFVSDTTSTFAIAPTVVDDVDSTIKNTAVTVPVAVNDLSCYSSVLGIAVATQPTHGTATVSNDSIVYTPASGFVGVDSFTYTATVGGSAPSAPGKARIKVASPTGILDIAEGQTKIYPNPASTKLHITTANTAITNVTIYDVLGNLVRSEAINSSLSVDVSAFNEGIYLVRFTGSEGKVYSSSRFTVVK